jgi:hypothetical protein
MCVFVTSPPFNSSCVRIRFISTIQYNPHPTIIRSNTNLLQKYGKGYGNSNIRSDSIRLHPTGDELKRGTDLRSVQF